MMDKLTKIPKIICLSIVLDICFLIGLLYFQPPISTVMIFAMLLIGFYGILRLNKWMKGDEA